MQDLQNYLLKKKQAERYRENQQQVSRPVPGEALYTPDNANFPGQVDVNWGSAIQNLGQGLIGMHSGYKADQAEAEAAVSRKAALEAMMGDTTPMTAEKIEALSQLGLSPEAMQMLVPEKDALGALTQAAATPQGRAVLVMQGKMTQNEADAIAAQESASAAAAQQAEKDQYLFEQENKRMAPPKPTTKSEFELYMSNPDEYAKYMAAKNTGKPGSSGSGGATSGRYDPAREAEKLKSAADTIEGLISEDKDNTMFGAGQTLSAAARMYGEQTPGTVLGTLANVAGSKTENPSNAAMRRLGIESTLESIAKMAPASDADIRILLSTMPNAFQTKEGALEFTKQMRAIYTKFAEGGYGEPINLGSGGPDIDSEIDALMGAPQ